MAVGRKVGDEAVGCKVGDVAVPSCCHGYHVTLFLDSKMRLGRSPDESGRSPMSMST